MSFFLLASTKQPSVLRNHLRQKPVDSQVLSRTCSRELTHSRDVLRSLLGSVSRKSRKLLGPEKSFVKLQPAYPVKLVFSYVVKG